MPRPLSSHGSPTLNLTIGTDQWDRAVRSHSGACLIADAIQDQYPQLTNVRVDMATIRATDRKRGVRYIYLTPEPAQLCLLSFDQGWHKPPSDDVVVKKAVQVVPVTKPKTGPKSTTGAPQHRAERLAALEAKAAAEEPMTRGEKVALTRLRKPAPEPTERPTARGAPEVKTLAGDPVILGGTPIPQGPSHPNLLRGRDRHFGAKLSDPGIAFREAVDQAVAERLGGAETG